MSCFVCVCEFARASRKQRVLLPLVDHLTGRGEIENRSWAVWQSEPVRAGARTTSSWRSNAANAAVAAVAAAAAAAWCSVRFRCSGCLVFRRALRSCFIVLSGVLFFRRVVSPPSKQFLRSVSVFFFLVVSLLSSPGSVVVLSLTPRVRNWLFLSRGPVPCEGEGYVFSLLDAGRSVG